MTKPSNLAKFYQELDQQIRGEVSWDPMTLGLYATDASIYQITPIALVVPRDADDVLTAVRIAASHNVSILPRGSGTSLNGQAVGASMILDFTKYMAQILELNVKEKWVRVQPGIVLDQLNATLAPHGLHFAPDPATSSRATIGGMIGNNSSGTKSIVYGTTHDHVLELKTVFSDSTVMDLAPVTCDKLHTQPQIVSDFKKIIDANRDEIEKRFPKVMRRVQGYNLDSFINTDSWNLAQLMVGSEGTLGVFLEAKLNLEPLPKHKALCVAHFADLVDSIRTVAPILEHGPSAVEILNADVLVLARKNLNLAPLCSFVQGEPEALLIIEFFADTPQQAQSKAQSLADTLQDQNLGYAWPVFTEPDQQSNVWALRKSGLGLMLGMKGDRKPLAFIEDACVPVQVLPEYIDQILKFCQARDVPVAMYAHASVGTIHVRPVLNLKEQQDIDHMKAIAEYAFTLITKYHGSWSGEHGDGRVRSPFLERFFGSKLYDALREVKALFDPAGLMNPGVIIDPNPMDVDLRYGTDYKTPVVPSEYHYREDGSFVAAVEMCNGDGACRERLVKAMCPSFRVTLDEEHTTRARANALRLAMTGQLGPDALTSPRLFGVLDLCISCKSCKSECPSNVDLAKLKSEFLQKYHDTHGTGLREKMIANSPGMAAWVAGWKAPFVNFVQRNWLFRKLLEIFVGFDSRRVAPAYARLPLAKWFARRAKPNGQFSKKVVLFEDTYMSYHQTEVGISAVELLESCGYEVILANAGCCQRPKISHGFLRKAKILGEKTLRNLDVYIKQGLKVVVCEPGCCSALVDDLPDLIDDEQLGQRIKENVMMIDEFLDSQIQQGQLNCNFSSPFTSILIHGHCHQKALFGTTAMKRLLDRVPHLSVQQIDSGCCGMAGSFGYEKEHYDLSMQIGDERLFPAIRSRPSGAAVVACGFSCRHQIADGTGVRPLHWTQTIRGQDV